MRGVFERDGSVGERDAWMFEREGCSSDRRGLIEKGVLMW